jgi:hydrogenase nickel incorporation protein HypA/HybF
VHEASIVEELIALARSHAPAGSRVLSLQVTVGLLTGVSPDAMRFYFEALRSDTLGPQAELEVRLAPLRGHCSACQRPFVSEEAIWTCPACDEPFLSLENGDELDLASLVVDDGEPNHDRTEDPQEERRHRPGEPAGA